MDNFSTDCSGKEDAAICQTAGDTGISAAFHFFASLRRSERLNAGVFRKKCSPHAPTRTFYADVLGTEETDLAPVPRLSAVAAAAVVAGVGGEGPCRLRV